MKDGNHLYLYSVLGPPADTLKYIGPTGPTGPTVEIIELFHCGGLAPLAPAFSPGHSVGGVSFFYVGDTNGPRAARRHRQQPLLEED